MPNRTPAWYLSVVTFIGLVLFFFATYLAQAQPSLGLSLGVNQAGQVSLLKHGVGPSEGIHADWTLERVSGVDGDHLVTEQTIIEEPDVLGAKSRLAAFYQDQDALWQTLHAGPVTLSGQSPSGPWSVETQARSSRALFDLPARFWIQLLSGLAATLVAGWVWSLNPHGAAQRGLLFAGIGLQFSASMAGIYSSRELGLPAGLFSNLSTLNHTGTLAFGIGLVVIFSTYPKQFLSKWRVLLPLAGVVIYTAVMAVLNVQSLDVTIYLPVLFLLIAILGLIVAQFISARKDPMARAALRVLGLGVIIGAGVFVLTRAVPIFLGLETAVSQALLFPLIALFFVSVALSVVRYRLFDMPRWSAFLLFYFLGACLILAMDAVLVYGLALARQPSLALSLLCVGFAYLPLRDRVMRLVTRRSLKTKENAVGLLAMADFIARAETPEKMKTRWRDSLNSLFEPLDMSEITDNVIPARSNLIDFGRALELPSLARGIPPLRLTLPKHGERLFTAEDRAKASEVMSLVAELQRGHAAYDSGVETERSRIARDLHDHISIHLLGALHSNDAERKNEHVRETLANLRRIISGDPETQTDLGLLLNELRFRISETLSAKGIALNWPVGNLRGLHTDEHVAQTIRAITYEAMTNVIRHSKATNVSMSVKANAQAVTLVISDDGVGLEDKHSTGNGLTNMRERVAQLGGTVTSSRGTNDQGLTWAFEIPFNTTSDLAQSA